MKILYVTTILSTVNAFLVPHIRMLMEEGHTVEIASNIDTELDFHDIGKSLKIYNVPFQRNPLSKKNVQSYKIIKEIVKKGNYDIIHVHTPVASVITRIAAYKVKSSEHQMIYTAHGFHFYKGASLVNWILYYPIEVMLSRYTDYLITINEEDYKRARKNMKAKNIIKISGVGVRTTSLELSRDEIADLKNEIGVPLDCFLISSTGELNSNKNHKVIIESLSIIENPNIFYLIIGKGYMEEELTELINRKGLENNVKLLGYRTDVLKINQLIDVFAFPSIREGLGMAALEAMSFSVPVITSNVHGINDYSINNVTGHTCAPDDVNCFRESISNLYNDEDSRLKYGRNAKNMTSKYQLDSVILELRSMYREIVKEIK